MTRTFPRIAVAAAMCALVAAACSPSTETAVAGEGRVVQSMRCHKPAPATAAAYDALWLSLPDDEWGGGDVSISVPLADNRVVWLYGDTFSSGRMVHSSAVVQIGGCVRAANRGVQVLPNRADGSYYWIEAARAVDRDTLHISAEETRTTGTGAWSFQYTGYTAVAEVDVTPGGDLTFRRWVSRTQQPAADPGTLIDLPGPSFGYSVRSHPWARLASGETLYTMAQNYDDGLLRPPTAYRPLWHEGDPR
ncbi:MAG: hypothetical protein ACRCYU_12095 [Nocardioides sp.]